MPDKVQPAGRAGGAAALVFALDQAIKLWVLRLDVVPDGISVGPFVRIVRLWNTGVNFGLLDSDSKAAALALAAFAAAVGVALLVWTARHRKPVHNLACGVVAGGAFGNALDRVLYGAVHDYLNVTCCGFDNPYAFNIADTAVVLGVVVLVLRR